MTMIDREKLRPRLCDILGSGPSAVVDPAPRTEKQEDCGSHIRRLVSYQVEADDRAYAWLLIPRTMIQGPRPLIMCPHQTKTFGKDGPVGLADDPQYHYALHLVERGFVCFAPDEFPAGQRLRRGQKAYDTSFFYQKWPDWSAAGKALWDLQRALDFLVKYDFGDTSRIGAIGHSLGGHDSMVLAAFDTRIKAAVINCGATLLRTDPQRTEFARTDDHDYVYYKRLRPYVNDPEHLPYDFDKLAMLIAPRALLMIHALNDEYLQGTAGWFDASREVSDYYTRLGKPGNFSVHFHRQTHCFPPEARALAYTWLDRQLKNVP